MKRFLFPGVLILLLLLQSGAVFSQTEVTLLKNDSLIVELEGYEGGEIYWERSYNPEEATSWTNISIAKGSETLRQKVIYPAHYRTRIVEGTCDPFISHSVKANIKDTFVVNAGHGYAEPYTTKSPGLAMSENGRLSDWSNTGRKAVWYLYHRPGKYNVHFYIKSVLKSNFKFEMNTSPCYDGLGYEPQKFDIQCNTSGSMKNDTIKVFTIDIPATGYYRYELTSKQAISNTYFEQLIFEGIAEAGVTTTLDAHTTKYLSSPSVHLNFSSTASTTKQYDWLYEEIVVPAGWSPLSTFWMALGFFRGYMGIQANSDTERRVLFSVWDSVDRDVYPDANPEYFVSLVDKGENTTANGFGGEGTGGQSYVGINRTDTWLEDKPVKFLMNVRQETVKREDTGEDKLTVVLSAWYMAHEEEGWVYVASWRAPVMEPAKEKSMFDGFHSFLENYGWRNGQIARKGYYYNAFGREYGSDRWVHLNKASFSNTDGKTGQRIDFEQGVSEEHPDKFYMLSGGYGKTKKTSTTLPLITDFPYLQNLDLTPFNQRVDEALVAEAALKNLELKDKSKWKMIAYSSQEATGEANGNGLAALIIDGDVNTYWHSKWKGGSAKFPHQFVIDMGQQETIEGFKFTVSGGTSRHPKGMKIETSNTSLSINSASWANNVLLETEAPDAGSYILKPENPATFRYFRVTIIDGHNSDVHTRMNEIDVF